MSWGEVQLKDITTKIGSGVTPKGGSKVYQSQGVSLIRSQNVYNGSFDYHGLAFIDEAIAEKMSNVEILPNDVLINITGDSVARCCSVPEGVLPARVNQHVAIVRLNEKVDSRYIMNYLISPYAQKKLLSFAAAGATRQALTKSILETFEVPFPPLQTQKRIASILTSYDDLIENNLKRIKLLEEAAQKIYKEWFVSMRFPNHESAPVDEETGLPEGWELMKLSAISKKLEDGDWIESKDQGGDEEAYRIVQISNIGVNCFIETSKFRWITEETFQRLNCQEVKSGDILIARMPNGIGRSWLVDEMPFRMVTVVDVAILRTDQSVISRYYLNELFNTDEHINKCEMLATGTTRKRIAKRVLGSMDIVIPTIETQELFQSKIQNMYIQKNHLRVQNSHLKEAKDILLPRLMNRTIEV